VALSNLAARVLFAVVAIPVLIAVVLAGGLALAVLLAVVAGLAAWEYYRIAHAAREAPMTAVGTVLAVLIPLGVHAYHAGHFNPPVLTLGAVIVLIVFSLAIWLRGVEGRPIGAAATTIFGVLYSGGLLSFAYGLRYHNYAVGAAAGTALLLYPLVLTWTSDSAAYFVGRAIGRHKLSPSVSPGKTVEGAVGALVVCILVSWVYARYALPRYAMLGVMPGWTFIFGVVVSVAVQLGDLTESLIKREAGVKDSSHLIPGHGGVLDRIDGMLFALPVAYLLLTFPHVLVPALR
jgi:phosphatidate cytidylyltransferase